MHLYPLFSLLVFSLMSGLAGQALAMMLVYEEGPFELFSRIRDFAGIVTNEFGQAEPMAGMGAIRTTIAKALMCPYCTSVYTTVVWAPIATLASHNIFLILLSVAAALGVSRYLVAHEMK